MRHLIYLFFIAFFLIFTACGSNDVGIKEAILEQKSEVAPVCTDDCQKACCLGCKATKGDVRCIILADGSMPCCVINGSDMY